ncbi:alpha-1,3-mannosyl-glycoprotein 4-beta-N-acetylglucosaminyltransferase-like protein MGAT4D isoform X5 [Dermochelys coriacea]|uniref:alpha-1,3-mannosyl-glycoprotein 4-beta-N-acetylglucosaminyltransferase-like protein MGAT4D isoform X5 n=1 Tax=Dermochelys coriacea TaxID=27794 RepID=UPI0018E7B918|nr:alpha-1,3-mannosyl-glycoprotein 4-beta-N-acetylglucosaminyltransferase-like protein MGAT4D isoform X5 [Dermochelys coriacea]
MRLKPGSIVTFLCLGAAFCFVCFTAWSRSGGSGLDMYQSQFLELHQRLLYAEKENKKRSRELSIVLDAVKRVVAERLNSTANHTDVMKWKVLNFISKFPLHLTNIHYYLPHLREHENSLYPNVVIGQGRTGVSLVMGIPTVKRGKQSYLLGTLNSLFYEMSAEQKNDCVVVIFVGEVNAEYVNNIAESVRTRWRTKQNLDYSFLMLYAQSKGTFYLQLEDDIVAKPQYIQKIKTFALKQPSDEWMILEFSQLGFIGKLFRTKDLPLIVEFFLMFYKDKPIDWLLDHLLWVKVCSPEKDPKHCEQQKAYLRIRSKPSLFQHVGIHSSLAGKIQNLKDKDFGKNMLHKAHVNPPAKVTTSLRIFQHYTLEKAYEGMDCFWAFSPVAGDYILFTFLQPLKVEGYLFRSGNMEHPGDKLFNTTVEVWPAAETELLKDAVGHGGKVNDQTTKDGYLKTGYWDVRDPLIQVPPQPDEKKGCEQGSAIIPGIFDNGIAEGIISPSVGKIQAIRLSIHSDSPVWALLSEILIKTS